MLLNSRQKLVALASVVVLSVACTGAVFGEDGVDKQETKVDGAGTPASMTDGTPPPSSKLQPPVDAGSKNEKEQTSAMPPEQSSTATSVSPGSKPKQAPAVSGQTQSSFANSFLNINQGSSAKPTQKPTAAASTAPASKTLRPTADPYAAYRRSYGTRTYSTYGGNNSRMNSYANNQGFQSGNNARGSFGGATMRAPVLGTGSAGNSILQFQRNQNQAFKELSRQFSSRP
jgi:hypothetical protein